MATPAPLRPMDQDEYDDWIAGQVAAYGADLAEAAGSTLQDGLDRATEQLRDLLPDGLRTEGHRLLRVLDDDGAPVGVLWVGAHPQRAGAGWVWDVEIDEHRRGEGLGRAAMLAAEALCREAGWTAIGLNVFGHNPRARALYDSLGYSVVATTMAKSIDQQDDGRRGEDHRA